MKQAIKRAVRSFVPPVLLDLYRAARTRQPTESAERRALRIAFEELNRDTPPDTIRFRPGLTFRIHPGSRRSFEAFAFAIPGMVAEMDAFLAHATGRRCLLDIGAMHGVFSLAFGGRAIAVDPSPVAFAHLLYNVHGCSLITPVECALADKPGSVPMHYEGEHAVVGGAGLTALTRTGDELCNSLAASPDLVKIDVEGYEVRVLAGLHETLRRCRPVVFIEVHPERIRAAGNHPEDVGHFFTSLDYKPSQLGTDPPTGEHRLIYLPG